MEHLRTELPKTLGGLSVVARRDYQTHLVTNAAGTQSPLGHWET